MSQYLVSVGTGGCFPQTITIQLRPNRFGVSVTAHQRWQTARRLRGVVPAAALATFASEVIARAAATPEDQRRTDQPAPWTDYTLPNPAGTDLTEHSNSVNPALADWLGTWLDGLATVPDTKIWVPRPLARSLLARRLGNWLSAALATLAVAMIFFGLVAIPGGFGQPAMLMTGIVFLATAIGVFIWRHNQFGDWIPVGPQAREFSE